VDLPAPLAPNRAQMPGFYNEVYALGETGLEAYFFVAALQSITLSSPLISKHTPANGFSLSVPQPNQISGRMAGQSGSNPRLTLTGQSTFAAPTRPRSLEFRVDGRLSGQNRILGGLLPDSR